MRTEKKPDSENKPGSDEHADLSTILAQVRYTLPIAVMSIPVILGLNWVLAPHNMGYAIVLLAIAGFGTAVLAGRREVALLDRERRHREDARARAATKQAQLAAEQNAQEAARQDKLTIAHLEVQLNNKASLVKQVQLEQTGILDWLMANDLWGETASRLTEVAGTRRFVPRPANELGSRYLVITSLECVAVFTLFGGEHTFIRLQNDRVLRLTRLGNETFLEPFLDDRAPSSKSLARFGKWSEEGLWTEIHAIDEARAEGLKNPRAYLTSSLTTAALLAYGAMRENAERDVHERKIATLTAHLPRA